MLEVIVQEELRPIISDLLEHPHPIFKRIAIHTINNRYDDLHNFIWDWPDNPLDNPELKHELFVLFKQHSRDFNEDQLSLIIKWIENIKIASEKDETIKHRFEAKVRKEWYLSIKNSENPEVLKKYEENSNIYSTEILHPGFDYWSETKYGDESPIDVNTLNSKTNVEIAEYLSTFKEKDTWDEPSEEGLASVLEFAVKEKPEKYDLDLEPFLNVKRKYQAAIIRGFIDVWKSSKECDWQSVFEFIKGVITKPSTWEGKREDERYGYHDWMIRSIADFIQDGTRNDNHAFDPALFPMIEEIIIILLRNSTSYIEDADDRLVTAVLNSGKGQIYVAFVLYSLRWARLFKKDSKIRWKPEIRQEIERRLNPEIEFKPDLWVTLGQYLPNLFWLDRQWVINNFNRIFPLANETIWMYSMIGYLFFADKVYEDIYKLFREHGHYSQLIQTHFPDNDINERVVGHICVAYHSGWEDLSDKNSLISQLINNQASTQIRTIGQFFINHKTDYQLKPLWKELHEIIIDKFEYPEFQVIASKFSLFIGLFSQLDEEIVSWTKRYVPYVEKAFNLPYFVEALVKHVNQYPEWVGELYLELLIAGVYPDYDEKDIIKITETLYTKSLKDTADRICNMHAENGQLFLRDIYEKYQNKSN